MSLVNWKRRRAQGLLTNVLTKHYQKSTAMTSRALRERRNFDLEEHDMMIKFQQTTKLEEFE